MQTQITTSYKQGIWKVRTAETKIILILCYDGILVVLLLCFFAVRGVRRSERLAATQQYFVCEAAGTGMECDRSNIENFLSSVLFCIGFVLLGFAPAVNLIFVVNWTGAKSFCRVFWVTCSKKFSRQTPKTVEQQWESTCNEAGIYTKSDLYMQPVKVHVNAVWLIRNFVRSIMWWSIKLQLTCYD